MDDTLFDKIADEELHYLEKKLADLDPDELEVDLASGVLTLTFSDEQKIVVNSHRAAGEIWMAAFRRAWHFAPESQGGRYEWRVGNDELRSTLQKVIGEKLGHSIFL